MLKTEAPQGLKPSFYAVLAARLKPCPDTKQSHPSARPQNLKP